MMLDSHDLPDAEILEADLCIVGAGAAGIAMALEFARSGIDVIVLEAGGREEEADTQALYQGSVVDAKLHSPPDRYRQRRFGGSTTIWGGRCMPFDAIDFERRDYVPHSGWPITLAALAPFYPKANRLCEAGDFDYDGRSAFHDGMRPMIAGFDATHFSTDTLERFSCPTDFGARYARALSSTPNVRLVLHANVTAINLDPLGGHVASLTFANLRGGRFGVRARHYVLATGGLETPRLLLASREVQRDGIGNEHDAVGRYYMCHMAGTIGSIRIAQPRAAVWHGYERADDGVYCRRRLALRESAQRALRLGNFIARLHHPRITDPAHRNAVLSLLYLSRSLIPYEYRTRLIGEGAGGFGNWLQHARNVASGSHEAVGFAWHMLRDRKLAERKFPSIIIRSKANLYSLDFHAEQEPNPSSRVQLSNDRDALGMPRVRIDWRYTTGDLATVTRSLALLTEDLRHGGAGSFEYDPAQVEAEMIRYGAYGGHHIGTARMGNDPRHSVVDEHCRVHGIANLHLAGAATFPTSSQANPTLTIIAMALRLSARLKQVLHAVPARVGTAGGGELDVVDHALRYTA